MEVTAGLKSRLKEEMLRNNLNAKILAEKAGLGQSFIYDILNGKSANPTITKLSVIANILGVSLSYLVDGVDNKKRDVNSVSTQDFLAIPVIVAVPFQGGRNQKPEQPLYIEESSGRYFFHSDWIVQELKSNPKNLRIIFLRNESMEPVLLKNDLMLIDISETVINDGGIFAIHNGIGIDIRNAIVDDGKIQLVPSNKRFKTYEYNAGKMRVIGKIVWFSRNLK